jgi:hypothetical protein
VEYAGRITVQDARGSRFQLHEYRRQRFFWCATRFVLDTGELVKQIDNDNYVITKTGERLIRIIK